jgi:hypothetical protein
LLVDLFRRDNIDEVIDDNRTNSTRCSLCLRFTQVQRGPYVPQKSKIY